MKICSACKEAKSETELQRNRTTQDGLQDQCKPCRKKRDRQTYINRSPEQLTRYREQNLRNIELNKRLAYEYLLQHPYMDWGEPDPVELEFDHVIGKKQASIANMMRSGRTWKRVYEEILKCEVRCANCHRRVTAQRNGTWKKHIWGLENKPT